MSLKAFLEDCVVLLLLLLRFGGLCGRLYSVVVVVEIWRSLWEIVLLLLRFGGLCGRLYSVVVVVEIWGSLWEIV